MAKIIFNDKNYNIDDATLASAKTSLKSYLSTTMAGTGATIELDGTTYNIDGTKLSTATNNFVAHLGTIAGNGLKVVIGGVEYSVDSAKVASALSELETALSNLSNPTTENDGITLLSSDNLILKDSNGLFLTAKEDK